MTEPDTLRAGRPCADLDYYFDDELPAEQADAFRDHLATCERCQRLLHGRMQEQVAVSTTRQAPPEDAQLAARLSMLGTETTREST